MTKHDIKNNAYFYKFSLFKKYTKPHLVIKDKINKLALSPNKFNQVV